MIEKIPYTMVIHKYVYGADTQFTIMEGPLANNPLGKWLRVIIRGSYQAAYEDSRWEYESVSDIWTDIDHDSDSSNDGSSDKEGKYQEKLDYQEQGEVVLVPSNNPRRLIQGNLRALSQLKNDIQISKDKHFSLITCLPG